MFQSYLPRGSAKPSVDAEVAAIMKEMEDYVKLNNIENPIPLSPEVQQATDALKKMGSMLSIVVDALLIL